jgi:hypothetical protein
VDTNLISAEAAVDVDFVRTAVDLAEPNSLRVALYQATATVTQMDAGGVPVLRIAELRLPKPRGRSAVPALGGPPNHGVQLRGEHAERYPLLRREGFRGS